MTKSLSVASVIEKNKISSGTPWLICLDIAVVDPTTRQTVEMIYLVRDTETITFNGHEYTPASFDVQLSDLPGSQTSVQLAINDYTGAIQSQMQQYGGGVGFNVTISVVNAGNLTQPPEVVEYFAVTASSSTNWVCTFTLGAENALTKTFPLRLQTRDFCQSVYGSTVCGYQGNLPTCDLSLNGANGCKVHANQANFSAFPGINTSNVSYS
jgi:phage-related protein